MTGLRRIILNASIVTASCLTATAEPVRLVSPDRGIDISGELQNYDADKYVLETDLGEIRVSRSGVRCEGTDCPTNIESKSAYSDIAFFGSRTIGTELMPLLIEGFAESLGAAAEINVALDTQDVYAELISDQGFGNSVGYFNIMSSISDDAFLNLRHDVPKIGMSTRRITRDEATELRSFGSGNMVAVENEHYVAVDNLVVIVNPENPISRLSFEEVAGIFSGSITDWSQIGGEANPIQVVQRKLGTATREVFDQIVFQPSQFDRAGSLNLADDAEIADVVLKNPLAIGYVSSGSLRGTRPINIISDCGITYIPDTFSAKTEEYPLNRTLYLYSRQTEIHDFGESFLNYATSPEADILVAKSGFVDFGVARREQGSADGRFEQLLDDTAPAFEASYMLSMLSTIRDYDRLSSTFRFGSGSDRLTPRGRLNLERLSLFLQSNHNIKEVLIVGFTDDVGAFESNLRLSENRANRVLSEISQAVGETDIAFSARGFGEIAPVVCNTNDTGKFANRRVEVWVRKE